MKQYDSSDLMDVNSLVECDLQWASMCIVDLTNELIRLQEKSKTEKYFCSIHFDEIIEKAKMFQYLVENRKNYHNSETERLTVEMGE